MEDKLLFDWVSITSKIHSPQNFIQMLGMAKENIVWGRTNREQAFGKRQPPQVNLEIIVGYQRERDIGSEVRKSDMIEIHMV